MSALREMVGTLEYGTAVKFRNLTMVPVQSRANGEPPYLLFREAVEHGLTQVTEVGGGVVPEVALENSADLPVLLVAGEELVGAKQNRMVNLTILAPAKSKIVIPVSCVEAGRWRSVSSRFAPADHLVFSRLRAQSAAYVTENLRREGRRHTRQHLVWDSIAERCRLFEAESGTGAVDAIFERRRDDLGEFVRAMQWQEGQAGAAFLIDDRPAGIDVFDHPGTMREMLQKLVRSYAVDALGEEALRKSGEEPVEGVSEGASGEPAAAAPVDPVARIREWLSAMDDSGATVAPAVGMGQDFRLDCGAITAAALWALDRFVHFCAFPREADEPEPYRAWGRFASRRERMDFVRRRRGGESMGGGESSQ
ncbi:MAG: DUF6569 family protein [Bryobacteraceae bacterium]